jgi:hypothetical protein
VLFCSVIFGRLVLLWFMRVYFFSVFFVASACRAFVCVSINNVNKERMDKMIRLIDNNKAVEISIREWDDETSQYGPDWSADFFGAGGLKPVEGEELTYVVGDVDYCIEYANDMVAGEGDFAGEPQPDQFVDVTELDRSAYPANL